MMYGGGGSSSGGAIGGGTIINCQDCGNKAKKDCPHMRCRSCCKSQGFHCETHVKSTWIPAARRRQKQHQLSSSQHHHQQEQQQLTLGGGDNNSYYSKRPRDYNNNPAASSSSLVSSTLACTSTDMGGNFPPELNSQAVFRCVRVSTAVDEEEDQYAYQTAVNIGGRIFKGILYDQGPDSSPFSGFGGGGSLGGSGGGPHQHVQPQPLDLINAAATTPTTTAAAIYPYSYPSPQSAFMAGTQFFPPPRPN